MNSIHGWPSEIRPGMTRPAGQAQANGDPGQWPPTLVDGRNLVNWSGVSSGPLANTWYGGCGAWQADSHDLHVMKVRDWWNKSGATRAIGMDIAHPGWEQAYIIKADAYCTQPTGQTGYIVNNSAQSTTASDAQVAQFLGRTRHNCGTWLALSLAQKRTVVGSSGALLSNSISALEPFRYGSAPTTPTNQFTQIDGFIHAVDAHCLKLAIQATNAPHADRSYPLALRPAGQATAPKPYSPWLAGAIGVAIGAIGMHFYMR